MIQRTTFQFQLWFKQVSIVPTLINDDISNFVISFLIFNNTFGLPPYPVTGTTRIITCQPKPSFWHWNSWVGGRSKIYSTKLPIYKKRHLPTVNTATNEHLFGHVGDVHGGNDEGPNGQKTQGSLWFERPTRLTFSWWFCKKMTCVGKIWLVEQDFYSFWPPKKWTTCTWKKKNVDGFCRGPFF